MSRLEEGQLAYLASFNRDANGEFVEGHASVVVKVGGRVYNINNQQASALKPNPESLPEWDKTWRKFTEPPPGTTTTYRLQPSRIHLPR
jgi:hypothetical protein